MSFSAKKTSKLYSYNALESVDEVEDTLERNFQMILSRIGDSSEKAAHDLIVSLASQAHDEVCLGLTFGILTQPQNAPMHYRNLTTAARDAMKCVIQILTQILMDKFSKFLDGPRNQVVWIIREMIRNDVQGVDGLCIMLMRNIAGGDLSAKNILLTEAVVDIFIEFKPWLMRTPTAIPHVAYTFLRLIADHLNSKTMANLKAKEISLCISLLREKFDLCITVGKDLIRVLIQIGRIPQIEEFFRDIIHNPSVLSPNAPPGVLGSILMTRSGKRFLIGRLTPDMERKLFFLLNQVAFGTSKRYQEWFHTQWLSTPESQTLRADLIRYICAVVHPSNEILCSDITPRWAVIGWLVQSATVPGHNAFARLSLFMDWLFFDVERESIMNIEPGALLMHHSIRSHPALTMSLLDYLCRTVTEFGVAVPGLRDRVRQSVQVSMRQILEKRVLQSFCGIVDYPKMDRELRAMVLEMFSEFCNPDGPGAKVAPHVILEGTPPGSELSTPVIPIIPAVPAATPSAGPGASLMTEPDVIYVTDEHGESILPTPIPIRERFSPKRDADTRDTKELAVVDAEFSDEDNEEVMEISSIEASTPSTSHQRISKVGTRSKKTPIAKSVTAGSTRVDIDAGLAGLSPMFKATIGDLKAAENNYKQCEAIQKFLLAIVQEEDFEDRHATALAHLMVEFFTTDYLKTKILPDDVSNEEMLEDCLQRPLNMIFRNLCLSPENDPTYLSLLTLLAEMYALQPRIGYHFLFFLQASIYLKHEVKMSNYPELCKATGVDMDDCLVRDLDLCQDDDYRMFGYIIPCVYTKFASTAIPSVELMRLVVGTIDAPQLQDIVAHIVQGNITLFRKDCFMHMLTASLDWETIEQYFFWQLIAAEDIPVEWINAIISKLNYPEHSEAMTNILIMLQRLDCAATTPLMRSILSRTITNKKDSFSLSALKILFDNEEDKFMEILSSQINKSIAAEHATGKQAQKKHLTRLPSLDQVLSHLDALRRRCQTSQHLFEKGGMRTSMKEVQKNCGDFHKAKYSELFSMMEVLHSARSGRSLRHGRKVKPNKEDSDSSEEETKPTRQSAASNPTTPPKKRKKVAVDSDSD